MSKMDHNSFRTAKELGIDNAERNALLKFIDKAENGEITSFDMQDWNKCIHGNMKIIDEKYLDFYQNHNYRYSNNLSALFTEYDSNRTKNFRYAINAVKEFLKGNIIDPWRRDRTWENMFYRQYWALTS